MIEQPENLRLGDLIAKRVPFIVPKYQRTYAWDAEEIDDYIKDLEEIYDTHTNNGNMTHFFGGIVSFEERAPNTSTRRVYNVIDGQQRLATFMITISLLVRQLRELVEEAKKQGDTLVSEAAESHAKKISRDFLEYDEVIGGRIQQKLRLTLSKADTDFFSALMAHTILSISRESHKRLKSAYEKINRFIVDLINEQGAMVADKMKHLLLLQTCLTEECYVILIVSDNRDEAYRLFSILNDRGKTLSDGDKLRSYTLEYLEKHSEALQLRVEKYWDTILGHKDSVIDDFLKYYYTSYEGKRAPARDVSDSFLKSSNFFYFPSRSLSEEQITEAQQIENRVSQMYAEQQVYSDISDSDWPYTNSVLTDWDRNRLKHLIKTLRHKKCTPILLSARQNMVEQNFADLVNLLERFVFRYISVVGGHAGKLDEIYYNTAKEIREKSANYHLQTLEVKLKDIQNKYAPDDTFTSLLNEQLKYNNQNIESGNLLVRYFFSTLEDYYDWYNRGAKNKPCSDKVMTLDLKVLNIEHIQPQNPSTKDKIIGFPTNNIGNLSIWSPGENNRAGNDSFAAKKTRYSNSNIRLNHYLATLNTWDITELEKRKALLFDMAVKIFTA